jgi:hypothetical protein
MHVTGSITALLLLTSSTLAAYPQPPKPTLSPWVLNSLSIFTPSGRPGNYPWLTMTANLTDPNTLILGTSSNDNSNVTVPAGAQAINCQAKWLPGETPFDRSWPCDSSFNADGWWTLKIKRTNDFSTTKFDAVFTRVAEVLYQGSAYKKVYEGSDHFEVGSNLSGVCGGSGVCSWGLKAELAPYKVKQKEIAAK